MYSRPRSDSRDPRHRKNGQLSNRSNLYTLYINFCFCATPFVLICNSYRICPLRMAYRDPLPALNSWAWAILLHSWVGLFILLFKNSFVLASPFCFLISQFTLIARRHTVVRSSILISLEIPVALILTLLLPSYFSCQQLADSQLTFTHSARWDCGS